MSKKKLEEIFKKNFKTFKKNKNFEKIKMNDLRDWDSINHVNLMLNIEKVFKIKLTASEFFQLTSVEKILSRLKK
jgi:acyl carrier protein